MKFLIAIVLGILVVLPASGQVQKIQIPSTVLTSVPFDVSFSVDSDTASVGFPITVRVGSAVFSAVRLDNGRFLAEHVAAEASGTAKVEILRSGTVIGAASARAIPGWLSIVPPILAILIALIFRRVVPALFLGVFVGAFEAAGLSLFGVWTGFLDSFQVYVLNAITDTGHASIILFSLMIGGMVGIVSKSGGMQGIVNHIVGWANSPRKAQVATGALGVAIFFDDYANTLVVGNTMRAVTDRLHVSREKLAYIVDSTAAPVSAIALVTTWIGTEVGLIGEAVGKIPNYHEDAYSIFLNSIPYSFYPILAVFFVFAIAWTRRDFGPMYNAEHRARTTGRVLAKGAHVDEAAAEGTELEPKKGKPQRVINAALPVLVLIFGVIGGLFATGQGDTIQQIIGSADSYKALMWASLLGVSTAGGLAVFQRILTLSEVVEAWYEGLKAMLFAMIILVLAWALSNITEVLHTADYLVHLLGDALVPGLVPALVFILAAATAFATGSSWSTMGILLPLVVPLAWAVLQANDMLDPVHHHLIYSTVASILAGSVWGDHCSPISDTTILSSMASGCDHIDHVRTQLPYALTVGTLGLLLGIVPVGFGLSWWISLPICALALALILRFVGKEVDAPHGIIEPIVAD